MNPNQPIMPHDVVFGGMKRHRIIPQPKNPYDVATIVSILPKPIKEVKETISPGIFEIEAAPENGFSILNIGSSSWWREVDPGQPLLEIPVSAPKIAESIIIDYCNGLLGCNMGDTMPGLFYLPGTFDKIEIVKHKDFGAKIAQAHANQRRWYQKLVAIADELWARTNGNPLCISNDSRYGAKLLGLQRTWLQDFQAIELKPCKGCGELMNPNFPICKFCKTINDEEKAKGIKFAG